LLGASLWALSLTLFFFLEFEMNTTDWIQISLFALGLSVFAGVLVTFIFSPDEDDTQEQIDYLIAAYERRNAKRNRLKPYPHTTGNKE